MTDWSLNTNPGAGAAGKDETYSTWRHARPRVEKTNKDGVRARGDKVETLSQWVDFPATLKRPGAFRKRLMAAIVIRGRFDTQAG